MIRDVNRESTELHAKHKGKLSIGCKFPINTSDMLSLAYTPGVAQPCREIAEDPSKYHELTAMSGVVAVITNGTAVLGLGDIGGRASMPVMEGKSALFQQFAGIPSVPLFIEKRSVDETVRTIANIARSFGGINLEDIAAPDCFAIERGLRELKLGIPVFHDDQHGTAIVVTAGLINAAKVVGKPIDGLTVVINGIGAAGSAIARMLRDIGVDDIVLVDAVGIINKKEPETMLNRNHEELAEFTNGNGIIGGLAEAVKGADVFIGVSKPGLLTQDMVGSMAKDAIIFAMANPVPEIMPDEAKAAGAAVIGTGRFDFPNQINNVLAFPGVFKGALDARAPDITDGMKKAAATALAAYIPDNQLNSENILPSALDKNVAQAVAAAVAEQYGYERGQEERNANNTRG